MAGCRVLTRPSRNSATPVTSATSVTGISAAARICAEPPVEIIVTPRAASAPANATIPLLSLTEISARPIGIGFALIAADIGRSRKVRQASRAAGKGRQQNSDRRGGYGERDGTPPVLRCPAAADKREIGGDHPLDHGRMAETATHGLLVEMLAVREPDALAAEQTARERNRRVGEEVERQDQRDPPISANREIEQQKTQDITERHAADIAEENLRRRPVPDEKTDGRPGHRGSKRLQRGVDTGSDTREQQQTGADRHGLAAGQPIDSI